MVLRRVWRERDDDEQGGACFVLLRSHPSMWFLFREFWVRSLCSSARDLNTTFLAARALVEDADCRCESSHENFLDSFRQTDKHFIIQSMTCRGRWCELSETQLQCVCVCHCSRFQRFTSLSITFLPFLAVINNQTFIMSIEEISQAFTHHYYSTFDTNVAGLASMFVS